MPQGSASSERLWSWVEQLGEFGASSDGAVSRYAWTPQLREALDWLAARCAEQGLATSLDAAGNLIAVWGDPSEQRVTVGSHVDTVPEGGRFDGALGVLCGLEAIALLRERGHVPRRPIALVAWMDEEGTRFGTPLFGSRAFVGEELTDLCGRVDEDGMSLSQALAGWNRSPQMLTDARGLDLTAAYLELHIEQGPILERASIDIGVVTEITGVLGLEVSVEGQANHAGTTPMDGRRDALVAASRAIVAIEAWAAAHPDGVRATVGIVEARPGGYNVIPGNAAFSIDVRVRTRSSISTVERELRAIIAEAAAAYMTESTVTRRHMLDPSPMAPELCDLLERVAGEEAVSSMRLPSGAGHDAMVLAPHVPTAMLFVPSRDGVSHNPAEHTDPEACQTGARVLAGALADLTA